jgi:hypothetical protein
MASMVLAGVGCPGMLVVSTTLKANDQPFSPGGDLDGDEETNLEEYQYVVGTLGLGTNEYISAATTPNGFWDGNPDLPVAGIAGLALLAAACVLAARRKMGKK